MPPNARHPDQLNDRPGVRTRSSNHVTAIRSRSEERVSMSTATEGDINCRDQRSSQPDRPATAIEELQDALACTSSPRWNAAHCRQTTSAALRLFFSDDIADINQAKRICVACPLAAACLQGALDRHEPCGV